MTNELGTLEGTLSWRYDDSAFSAAASDSERYGETISRLERGIESLEDVTSRLESRLGGLAGETGKAERGLVETAEAGERVERGLEGAGKAGREASDGIEKSGKASREAAEDVRDLGEQAEEASSILDSLGEIGGRFSGKLLGGLGPVGGKLSELTGGALDLEGGFLGAAGGAGDLGGGLGGLLGQMGSLNPMLLAGGAAAAAFGAALAGGIALAADAAGDLHQATNTVQAQFGVTAAKAEELGAVGLEVWRNNWGESIEVASVAAGRFRSVFGEMVPDSTLAEITQAGFALEQVFDVPIEEQQRALQSLLGEYPELRDQGTAAFDMIAASMQRTGDPADDLLDTVHEYAPQFRTAGFSAEEMFGLLNSGLEAGAFNADKVADAVKEFDLRITEGTDGLREQLAVLGPEFEELPDLVQSGALTSKDALNLIIEGLQEVELTEAQQKNVLREMGTMWEDIGPRVALALDTSPIENFNDAALDAGDAINANWAATFETFKRNVAASLLPAVEPFVDGIRVIATDALGAVSNLLAGISESDAFAAIAAGAGDLASGLVQIVQMGGGVLGIFGDLLSAGADLFGGWQNVAAILGTIGTTLLALSGPVGAVVTAVGGLAIGLGQLKRSGEEARAEFADTSSLDDYAASVGEAQREAGGLGGILASVRDGIAGQEANVRRNAEAWLVHNANVSDAVLENDRFKDVLEDLKTAHANGKITSEQFQQALLDQADAISVAAGEGHVLTSAQREQAAAVEETLSKVAAAEGGFSRVAQATAGYREESARLSEEVAAGTMTTEQAEEAILSYVASLETVGATISEDVDPAVAASREVFGSYAEAFGSNVASILSAGEGLLLDEEARAEKYAEIYASLDERVGSALEDVWQTRKEYNELFAEAAAQDAAAQREAQAEVESGTADHAEKMKGLQEKLSEAEGDGRAKIEEQIAAESEKWDTLVSLASEGTNAATAEVQRRYDEEREAIRASLAQTVIDHTNSMVLMGDVSAETASAVYEALATAYPDVEVINPATEATLEFNATVAEVLEGDRDASAIVDAIANVESSMVELDDRNRESLGLAEASWDGHLEAAESTSSAIADTVEESGGRLASSHEEIRAELAETDAAGSDLAGNLETSSKAVVDGQQNAAAGVRDAQSAIRSEFLTTESTSKGTADGIVNNLSGIGDAVREDRFSGLVALETNLQAADAQAGRTSRSLSELNAEAAELERPAEDGGSAFDRAGRDIESSAARGKAAIEEARSSTEDLGSSIEDLPEEIDVDLAAFLKNLDAAHTGLARMKSDIDAARAAGLAGVPIRAWIQAESPGAEDGGSIWYEHYIEDARAAGLEGIPIRTFFEGTNALANARDLLDYARELEDLIASQQQRLDDAEADVAKLEERVADAAASMTTAFEFLFDGSWADKIGGAAGALGAAIDEMLGTDRVRDLLSTMPEFGEMLNGLRDTFSFGADFFDANQILDPRTLFPFESLEQFRDALRELEDDPALQRELWDEFADAASDSFNVAGEAAIAELDAMLDRVGPSGVEGTVRWGLGNMAEALRDVIRKQAELLTEELEGQVESVESQAEAYDRLLDLLEERKKVEAQIRKEIESSIKDQEKEALEIRKRVFEQAMELLEAEEERLERQHNLRMSLLEDRLQREEDALEQAEEAHKRRLEQIGEEERRLQAKYDAEADGISDLQSAVRALEDGFELADWEIDALRAAGFDPEELRAALEESEKLAESAEGLRELLSKFADDSTRITKDDLTDAQRASLERALASGELSEREEKRIRILLESRGGIASKQIREIIERLAKEEEASGGPAGAADPLAAVKDRIAARQREQDLLKHTIEDEKEAADALREAERQRWESEQAAAEARIAEIEGRIAAEERAFDIAREELQKRMELEKKRHDERLRQIQEEYALELLRLGEGEDAVRERLERQRELARQISEEAARVAEEARRAAEEEARRRMIPPGVTPVLPPPGGGGIDPPPFPPPGGGAGAFGGGGTSFADQGAGEPALGDLFSDLAGGGGPGIVPADLPAALAALAGSATATAPGIGFQFINNGNIYEADFLPEAAREGISQAAGGFGP